VWVVVWSVREGGRDGGREGRSGGGAAVEWLLILEDATSIYLRSSFHEQQQQQ